MVFEVKIKFLHKGSKRKEIESKDGFTAITKALETLNSTEKDNVSAVLITDIKSHAGDQYKR
ncbi:hypothetical protein D5F11_021615 [Siminovitchia terrae]|uniref:Uncharacterized protein n=1 Tax=Siminovitchia terrae TaxID=1914933 RepID=A0A429X2F7_SIMTE|nr:hypothetical protein [Siminovitchia terrae]RST57661.1 hypothetical protein D5F11_021615 [Siminovitchia terrae]